MPNKKYNTIKQFVSNAKDGERFVYHSGDLASDRKDNDDLNKVALTAMDYYQRGFVELFQKKLSRGKYEYIAERCTNVGRRFFRGCYEGKPE